MSKSGRKERSTEITYLKSIQSRTASWKFVEYEHNVCDAIVGKELVCFIKNEEANLREVQYSIVNQGFDLTDGPSDDIRTMCLKLLLVLRPTVVAH